MGVYGALYAGVSGLTAQANSMSMISDNIANVNTIGYKASKARFTTLVTQPSSPRSYNSGGVLSNTFQMVDQQGLLQSSSSSTDLAVSGRGFFVTSAQVDPTTGIVPVGTERLFTRAGSFTPNKDGRLVNAAGRYLLGVSIPNGTFADPDNIDLNQLALPDTSQLTAVNVARLTSNSSRTSVISLGANIATVTPLVTSPTTTQLGSLTPLGSTFQTSQTIYDSLGVAHTMTLVFTRDPATTVADRQFSVGIASMTYIDSSGNNVSSGTVGGTAFPSNPSTNSLNDVISGGQFFLGTINFNTDGSIQSFNGSVAGANQVSISWATGAWTTRYSLGFNGTKPDPTVTINSGSVATTFITIGTRNAPDGLTNYDSANATTSINQNGVPFGYRTGVQVDDKGIVRAIFDNGARVPVAVIPLVTFTDVNNLQARTDNTYAETQLSGGRTLNYAGRGGAGLVKGNALESSTVDLAEEFTNMIVTQRAYQANTRTITTADQMLQDILQIVR